MPTFRLDLCIRISPIGIARIALYGVAVAAVLAIGFSYYSREQQSSREHVERELEVRSKEKATRMLQWRKERIGDGRMLMSRSRIPAEIARWMEQPEEGLNSQTLRILHDFIEYYDYQDVLIVDEEGALLLSLVGDTSGCEGLDEALARAVETGDIEVFDLHRHGDSAEVFMSIVVPMLDESQRVIAGIVLVAGMDGHLEPLFGIFEDASDTGEVMLIRVENGDALVLNHLRLHGGSAMSLRIPLQTEEDVVAMAARNQLGFIKGRDYRGKPVIAHASAIEGTPWLQVTKIDAAEAFAGLRRQGAIIIIIGIICGAGLVAFAGWALFERFRNAQTIATLKAAERIERSEAALVEAQRIANVGSWEIDHRAGSLHWSKETHRIFGTDPASFTPTREAFERLLHPDDRQRVKNAFREALENHKPYHAIHRLVRPDGTIRHVEERCETEYDKNHLPVISRGTVQDITGRIESEAALQSSEQRFQRFMDEAPAYVYIKDATLQHVYLNRRVSELADELGTGDSRGSRTMFDEETTELVEAADRRILNGESQREELQYPVHVAGNVRWLDDLKFGLQLVDGSQAVGGIALDVTTEHEALESLRHSEATMAMVGKLAKVGGWAYDVRKNVLEWSQEVTAIHEEAPGFIPNVGRGIDYYAPEWRGAITQAFGRCLRDGEPYDLEMEIITARGHRVWVRTIGQAVRDENGAIVRIQGALQDISRQKQVETELRLLGAAIDQAAETIIITDAEGTIQYVNPSFTRTTGYSRDEAIGQNPRILKSGLQDQFFYQKMWGAISAGRTWEGRLVNRHKDGTQVTELATISPVRAADGRVKHFVAVKRDISEFVRLTEELTQAQKMESIGRLAGGVAHDFNNLITGVMGYAELALARLPEDHPVRDDIKSILKGAERTAGLTRQLLAFARKQTIEPRVIDLNDSISEMTRMLSRLIGEDIKLVWKPGADLWNVLMDPGQVEQLLANLCVNSRDAINGVGEIVITTANVVVGDEECFDEPDASPGKYVVLTIRDNGSGMSEEVARHAFDPFYTTKDIGKGTGLGLSTVFGIVKQNGGFIRLETSPGEGSAFHIHLPRDKGVAIKHGGASCGDRHVSDELRILVVEDDPAVRILLEMILRQCGHKLLSATTPDEAIKLANDHEDAIDLMITDVVMPGMNGRELADRLCPTRPEMRVIFISGYTADLIAKRGIIDDEVAFLSKPFTRDALMAKIDEVMAASPARVDS